MPTDTIEVINATAAGGYGEITYTITTDAPSFASCLPYENISRVEVYVASSNNRALATKVGDAYLSAAGIQYKITGLGTSVTRYAWFKAVNMAGNEGAYYPASATAGVAATTSSQVPPAGSVGPTQTGSNFSSLSSISANLGSITAGNISAVTITGSTITGNTFRTAASGKRIEITSADNYMRVYDGSGTVVGTFGQATLVPGWSAAILSVNVDLSSVAAVFQNLGTGPALVTQGQHWAQGLGNKAGFRITHTGTGSDAHGIWFDVGPSGSLGGAGICGVSAAGGSWAFYQNRGTLGPFTGSHPGLIKGDDDAIIGDILVDVRVLTRIDIDNTVTEVARSSEAMQKSVIGVLSKRVNEWSLATLQWPAPMRLYCYSHDYAVVNGVGEGQINVCGLGGDLEPGDFICTSPIPGKGMRQNTPEGEPDDLRRRCTVARVRERVTFDPDAPSDWKRVACIYECG